jgi:RNA-directed DNA polymerase
MPGAALVNIGALLARPEQAEQHVLGMQTKLHRWAVADPGRRFDDLFNLVADPAFLVVAWKRVRGNTGARSAGVDGRTARAIETSADGVAGLLESLRVAVKARTFRPLPARQRLIPKAGGKLRRLGIPTVQDRVVQASLKLVLEPILEAAFLPCSYGFRPRRRAQDAIEEIRLLAAKTYEWVLEGDIAACFDEIDHAALLARLRRQVTDKRVLALVKAFLKAGLLDEDGIDRDTHTGTPQGGILSPLLANLALSVLDEHAARVWQQHPNPTARYHHRRRGGATWRLVRYADDFVILVSGTRAQTQRLQGEVARVLAEVGLRLAPDKTRITHIDQGFDFLGFHIQRHRQRGSNRRLIYSYPSERAMRTIRHKIKHATSNKTTNLPAADLFRWLERILRGWVSYFRHGAASAAFHALQHYLWWRVWIWLRHKHPHTSSKQRIRRYYPGEHRWWPQADGVRLYQPTTMPITRYRYRGAQIPTPWTQQPKPA